MDGFGRFFIVLGVLFLLIGLLLTLGGRIPWLGRLPGDIHIERGNFSCFIPIATSIVLSLLLTVVLNLLLGLFRQR